MAGRNLGFLVLVGTSLATIIGTGSTVGGVGLGYTGGWSGCLWALGLGSGVILVGLLFAPMRNFNLMTLGEEVACYYGGNSPLTQLANNVFFLSLICWLGVQIMGGGVYLAAMTGMSYGTAVILAGAGFAAVTIMGGYYAVAYTDFVQVTVLTIGFIALLVYALDVVGGISAVRDSVPHDYLTVLGIGTLGWEKVISIPLALALSTLPEPTFRHRLYSARTAKQGQWSLITTGVLAILFSIVIAALGMITYVLNPDLPHQDQALPWLALEVLPLWFAAIVIVCGFAATFSSADSDAATGALYFIRHLWPQKSVHRSAHPIRMTRWTIGGMFLLALLIILPFQSIVEYVVNFVSIVLSGLAVVVVLGRFWPGATWQGGIAAIVCGAATALMVLLVPGQKEWWGEAIIPATLVALVAEIVVSLVTAHPKPSIAEVALIMQSERKDLES